MEERESRGACLPGRRRLLMTLAFGAMWPRRVSAAPVSYVEDPATARSSRGLLPRMPLRLALEKLSLADGLRLTASPALSGAPILGNVPPRPLRETMKALEQLFDGVWSRTPEGYRLDPSPQATPALAEFTRRARKELDAQAATAVTRARMKLPEEDAPVRELMAALLWSHLKPEQRDAVLSGKTVSYSLPAAQGQAEYDLALIITGMAREPLVAPMLVTLDLDEDYNGQPLPRIRTRITALRKNSITGAIHQLPTIAIPPRTPPPVDEDSPTIPTGGNLRFAGSRDEVLLGVAEKLDLPILSRHQPSRDTYGPVEASGRRLADLMHELGQVCGAIPTSTARGFQVLRSATEATDALSYPDAASVSAYLAARPKPLWPVDLETLSLLSPQSPLQLAFLARGSEFASEARLAMPLFAVMRFYRSLTPEQRKQLFSPEGLPAVGLTHAQHHAFLDERVYKRAGFEIHSHLQDIATLVYRFRESLPPPDGGDPSLSMECLRRGVVIGSSVAPLPRVPG